MSQEYLLVTPKLDTKISQDRVQIHEYAKHTFDQVVPPMLSLSLNFKV